MVYEQSTSQLHIMFLLWKKVVFHNVTKCGEIQKQYFCKIKDYWKMQDWLIQIYLGENN